MKHLTNLKSGLMLAIMLLFFVGFTTSCDDDDDKDFAIAFADLPLQSQEFVNTHFPTSKIWKVEQKHRANAIGSIYEVTFEGGTEVEFNQEGVWTEVDCEYALVPQSVLDLLPANILTYLATNHSGIGVEAVQKHLNTNYEIELINDLDLYFDADGQFIGMDR